MSLEVAAHTHTAWLRAAAASQPFTNISKGLSGTITTAMLTLSVLVLKIGGMHILT